MQPVQVLGAGKVDLFKVTDMSGMFESATKFGGGLSKWDVSKVTFTLPCSRVPPDSMAT